MQRSPAKRVSASGGETRQKISEYNTKAEASNMSLLLLLIITIRLSSSGSNCPPMTFLLQTTPIAQNPMRDPMPLFRPVSENVGFLPAGL